MKLQNARIVEMLGRHVVIADNAVATGGVTPRACRRTRRGKPPAEMAIVTWSEERARRFLDMDGMFVGMETTMARGAGNQRVTRRLKPRFVTYDRHGDGDDARIKEENPPPAGIDVSFHWGEDDVLRLEAVTSKDGEIATRSSVVETGEKTDIAAAIAKLYERISRTAPAATVEEGLRCASHVAALLERLDEPACAQLAAWRALVERTPRTARGKVADLCLPAGAIDPSMLAITLKAAKGRDLLEACVAYKRGTAIEGRVLKFRGDLPDTTLAALQGRTADAIWGQEELRCVTLGEYKGANAMKDGVPQHVFDIDTTAVPLPLVHNADRDDAAAAETLARVYAAHTFDAALRTSLSALPPAWLLHVLRAAFYRPDKTVDLDFAPGLEGVRVHLAEKHLRIERQAAMGISTLWR